MATPSILELLDPPLPPYDIATHETMSVRLDSSDPDLTSPVGPGEQLFDPSRMKLPFHDQAPLYFVLIIYFYMVLFGS